MFFCWIPISRIPLILGAGGFYVRGIGWIVVHQIIRAPGPYNEISINKNNKKTSEIILLSEVGSRIYIKYKIQDFTSLNLTQFFCNKYSDLFNNSEFITKKLSKIKRCKILYFIFNIKYKILHLLILY